MKNHFSLIRRYYNVLIAILAIISITLVILDYSGLILLSRYPYNIIDNSILIIFAIDYFARLFKSPDKLTFVKISSTCSRSFSLLQSSRFSALPECFESCE